MDWEKGSAIATTLTAVVTFLYALWRWPKQFFTRKEAEEMMKSIHEGFVKKVEPDGTRAYVHPQEWDAQKEAIEKLTEETKSSNEESRALRELCRDWMKRGE